MDAAPIVIVSGPPGAGKSTVAASLAAGSPHDRAVHLHTDEFYGSIRKGFVPPWLPEARHQNLVVVEAFAASAERYARGGYEVVVDGVVGPWHLDRWVSLAEEGLAVEYVVLRPDEVTTIERSAARDGARALVDRDVVAGMWREFADLGDYEANAIDTTDMGVDDTVRAVRSAIATGRSAVRRR
jgi:predicted kinase